MYYIPGCSGKRRLGGKIIRTGVGWLFYVTQSCGHTQGKRNQIENARLKEEVIMYFPMRHPYSKNLLRGVIYFFQIGSCLSLPTTRNPIYIK